MPISLLDTLHLRLTSQTSDLLSHRIRTEMKIQHLSAFRRLVPLTDYEAYGPWIAKFLERPCELSEVENLLAPGLPRSIAVSSSTSSNKRKHFA